MQGTSLSSATLAVGLQSIDPLEAVMMSTLSLRMSSLATSAVRLSSVWLSLVTISTLGLAADLQARRQNLTNAVERPILRFGEARHRTVFGAMCPTLITRLSARSTAGAKTVLAASVAAPALSTLRRLGLTCNSGRRLPPTSVCSSIVMSSLYGRRFLVSAVPTCVR
jgi:hypothetical protein